jgi:hypothetical protein
LQPLKRATNPVKPGKNCKEQANLGLVSRQGTQILSRAFVELVQHKPIVQGMEFESEDPVRRHHQNDVISGRRAGRLCQNVLERIRQGR